MKKQKADDAFESDLSEYFEGGMWASVEVGDKVAGYVRIVGPGHVGLVRVDVPVGRNQFAPVFFPSSVVLSITPIEPPKAGDWPARLALAAGKWKPLRLSLKQIKAGI